MKAIDQKIMVYDNKCPMCVWYTGQFVKNGMLSSKNRVGFHELERHPLKSKINLQKAKHEIPLIDQQGGETIYGIDALLYVLSSKIKLIGIVGRFLPVYWLLKRFYAMISYNRRIIVPIKKEDAPIVHPDFNLKYRLSYIVFAAVIAAAITYWLGWSLEGVWQGEEQVLGGQMLLIAGTGWLATAVIALLLLPDKKVDYLGQLATVMLIGVLVLVPGIVLKQLLNDTSGWVLMGSVLASSSIMLWQHAKRARFLALRPAWTLCWFICLQLGALLWITKFNLI